MQPNDPQGNPKLNNPDSQSPTFQIPKADSPAPTQVSQVPQPPVYAPQPAQPVVPNNLPPQPDRHQPPIFMQEEGIKPDIPLPYTKSGTASSVPGGNPMEAPLPQQQPRQVQPQSRQIPRPAPVQPPILPTAAPSRPRKASPLKYLIIGLGALLVAGLLIWLVVSIVSNDQPDSQPDTVEQPTYNDFTSEELGFTTAYPKGWTREEGRQNGLDLIRFSHPTIRDNNTSLAETVVLRLTSKQMKSVENKDQFFSTYGKAISSAFDSYSEVNAQELTIDKMQAKKIEADITQSGENDRAVFHFIYAKENGFIVISSADKAEYEKQKPNLDVFIDRFKSNLQTSESESESKSTE